MAREEVKMDDCHIQLIAGIAAAMKPSNILELGYGSGLVTHTVMEMIEYHDIDCNYTLVDNWLDWGEVVPKDVLTLVSKILIFRPFQLITSTEEYYVKLAIEQHMKFDLIISDADHQHSHEWFPLVIEELLADGGFAFFHDVTSKDHPNLSRNAEWLWEVGRAFNSSLFWRTFNKNSRTDERCERGLLMVGKGVRDGH